MREHDSGETSRQRMNKKKLPKAVLRTADQMREAAAERSQDTPHSVDLNETLSSRPAAMRTADRAANGNVIEMVPKADAAEAPQSADNGAAALRKRMAVATVERYANWAAVGGALPVPIANATAVTALMVRMIQSLSKLYGVPFEKNRTRAAVVGLMAGMLPTGLATVAASAVTYFVPGYGLLGLAASSVTSSAYTRHIGRLYIEQFESGSTEINFRAIVLR